MIGMKTVEAICDGIRASLADHVEELAQAYAESEDPFSIGIQAKIKPVPEGNRVDIGLNFVTGRVKDTVIRIINEEQMSFFEDKDKETEEGSK